MPLIAICSTALSMSSNLYTSLGLHCILGFCETRISESKALRPDRSAARTASRLLSPPLRVGAEVPLSDGDGESVAATVGEGVAGVSSVAVGDAVSAGLGGVVVGFGVADP